MIYKKKERWIQERKFTKQTSTIQCYNFFTSSLSEKKTEQNIYTVLMFFHTYHIYIELAALCDDDDILRMCDQRIQNERNKQTNEKKKFCIQTNEPKISNSGKTFMFCY